jgi:octaprenyl-diphosphate synthase
VGERVIHAPTEVNMGGGQSPDITLDAALGLVESLSREAVTSEVGLLSLAGQYAIGSGGKRLRPRIVLLSYQAAGGQDLREVVPVATALELLHTASLIHDDINDCSELRRGQPSVNARWGDSLALLIGDHIFVRLLNLIADLNPRLIRVFAECCQAVVEGETLQMLHRGDRTMTEGTYLSVIAKKTALLFAACGELGGLLAEGTRDQIAALREYGYNLGMAFQIRDDALDWVGTSREMGKPVAADLGQGKASLVTIYAGSKGDIDVWSSADINRMSQMLQHTGALDYATDKARGYAESAKQALLLLTEPEATAALSRMADLAVTRSR